MTFDPDKYMPRWYKLIGKKIVPCKNLYEWGEYMEIGERKIAATEIPNAEPWLELDRVRLMDREAQWHEMFGRSRPITPEEECKTILVSTVFLGLDHGYDDGQPVLFETLVFNGPLKDDMERYCTYDDALAGHHAIVKRVQDVMAMTTGEKDDADGKVRAANKGAGGTKSR